MVLIKILSCKHKLKQMFIRPKLHLKGVGPIVPVCQRLCHQSPSARSLCGNHTDAAEIYFPFLDTRDYFVYSNSAGFFCSSTTDWGICFTCTHSRSWVICAQDSMPPGYLQCDVGKTLRTILIQRVISPTFKPLLMSRAIFGDFFATTYLNESHIVQICRDHKCYKTGLLNKKDKNMQFIVALEKKNSEVENFSTVY